MSDGYEVAIGTNPSFTEFKLDADGDGFPNDFELRWDSSITDAAEFPRQIGSNAAGDGVLYRIRRDAPPNQAYVKSTIQEAIDAATNGDILYVEQDTYDESLSIIGPNKQFLLWFEPGSILQGTPGQIGISLEQATGTRIYGPIIQGYDKAVYTRESAAELHSLTLRHNKIAVEANTRDSGSPIFVNCLIHNNTGPKAAVQLIGGKPRLLHCTLLNNGTQGSSRAHTAVAVEIMRGFSTRSIVASIDNSVLWNPLYGSQLTEGFPSSTSTARAMLTGCSVRDEDDDGIPDIGAAQYSRVCTLHPHLAADGTPLEGSPLIHSPFSSQSLVPFDRFGTRRHPRHPDIGAVTTQYVLIEQPLPPVLIGQMENGYPAVSMQLVGERHLYTEWDLYGSGNFRNYPTPPAVPCDALDGRTVSYRAYGIDGIVEQGSVTLADRNVNQIPDAWELLYFGYLLNNTGDDPNGDGLTALEAFRSNRDPIGGGIGLLVYNP